MEDIILSATEHTPGQTLVLCKAMDEERLFEALARASPSEMLLHYEAWYKDRNTNFADLEFICRQNGWTWDELRHWCPVDSK